MILPGSMKKVVFKVAHGHARHNAFIFAPSCCAKFFPGVVLIEDFHSA